VAKEQLDLESFGGNEQKAHKYMVNQRKEKIYELQDQRRIVRIYCFTCRCKKNLIIFQRT